MFNPYDIINEKHEQHNSKWPYIPDHQYKMLIIGASGSGKQIHCSEFNERTR